MITFAIPTWNRPRELNLAVRSIAPQIKDGESIIILDHGSDEPTEIVINALRKDYPFIRAARLEREANHDYSHAFKALFQLADTKWTWTFGDDDLLLPGALELMRPALQRDEFEFLHVAEEKRSSQTGQMFKGTLMELCNTFGWIDMTGFITGNIVNTEKLKTAAILPSWDLFAKSAFVQSLSLLEVLKDDRAGLLDYAIINAQADEANEETQARWTQFDIGTRYFYLDEGLMDMRKRGVIDKLHPAFFRYLSYYLWDRFMQNLMSSFTTTQNYVITPMLDDLFKRVINLTTFLPTLEQKRFKDEILEVREAMEEYEYGVKMLNQKTINMDLQLAMHSREHFPFSFIKPSMKSIERDNKFVTLKEPTAQIPQGTDAAQLISNTPQ